MIRWLARLFGRARAESASPRSPAPAPGCAAAAPAGPARDAAHGPGGGHALAAPSALSDSALDLAFFRLLAGPHLSGAAGDAGAVPVFDALARLARDPAVAAELVPRVPAVIPQLLRSLRDDDSSVAGLANQLAQDPVLVAAVIREVNGPAYRSTAPVRNLEGALLLLGQNGLRMVLARVAFRPLIGSGGGRLARAAAPLLSRQSEGSALAGALLAPRHGADPFLAYLAGLMHNIGLVVALRLVDGLLPGGALPDTDAFGLRLVGAARLLSARIAGEWGLPGAIGHAIAQIGNPGDPGDPGEARNAASLPATLGQADRLAKLHLLAAGGQPHFAAAAAALGEPLRRVYDQLDEQPPAQEA